MHKNSLLLAIWSLFILANPLFGLGPSAAFNPKNAEVVATGVLEKLLATSGNFNLPKPKVILTKKDQKVAAYYPSRNLIALDEKAYLIARSLKKDSLAALAFLLGHELAHAFQAEVREGNAPTNFLSYDKNIQSNIRIEKVADIQGIFTAYLAGYNVVKIVPAVLEKIYEAYNLKDKVLKGYPTLEERKKAAHEVLATVELLVDLYENSQYLVAIEEYELALDAYNYILQYYQGREVYNNIGIIYTLAALSFHDPITDQFIYPLTLDDRFLIRERTLSRGGLQPHEKVLRLSFLNKALQSFEQANLLDPDYMVARINKMCVFLLMGDPQKTLQLVWEENLSKRRKKLMESLETYQMALALAKLSNLDQATKQEGLEVLEKLNHSSRPLIQQMADYNLERSLTGMVASSHQKRFAFPEKYQKLMESILVMPLEASSGILLSEKSQTRFFRPDNPGNPSSFAFAKGGKEFVTIYCFENQLAGNISITDSIFYLQNHYFSNIIPLNSGFIIRSEESEFLVKADENGKVKTMVRYTIE